MNHDDIRDCIDRALGRIAPDLDPATMRTDRDLVESADLDSMDFLNLMTAIETDLALTVPERDYNKVRTIDDMVSYLGVRLNGAST